MLSSSTYFYITIAFIVFVQSLCLGSQTALQIEEIDTKSIYAEVRSYLQSMSYQDASICINNLYQYSPQKQKMLLIALDDLQVCAGLLTLSPSAEISLLEFHSAVYCNYLETVKALIKLGFCINQVGRSNSNNTCLHLAAGQGLPEMLQLLIWGGADANITNAFGSAPIHIACIALRQNPTLLKKIMELLGPVTNAENMERCKTGMLS
jgi:ankyrin repeat protein